MTTVKIKLITLGHIPFRTNLSKINKWRSSLFEITEPIESFNLRCNSDGPNWEFSDDTFEDIVPSEFEEDFLFAIVNVPLEDNYYLRRLPGNRVVFTFHQIYEFLFNENIPLENAVLRVLYECSLVFVRANRAIPAIAVARSYTHDETRGCLFDMNGLKYELPESCNKPILCHECQETLIEDRVSNTIIQTVMKELGRIKKPVYYSLFDFIKRRPILSITISSIYAILLGVIGSMVASLIYDKLK